MPKRRTSISLGGGLLLALTLALSGCPGAADQESPDDGAPAAADSAQRAAPLAAADTSCPGPAPAPFDSLDPGNKSQPWSVVAAYLQQNPLGEPDAGTVKLCTGCSPLAATITPIRNSCKIAAADGHTWLMGKVAANGALTGANQGMFGNPGNDSTFVYLVTRDGSTYAIFPKTTNQGQTVIGYVPGTNGKARWNFTYCKDDGHGKKAEFRGYAPADWEKCSPPAGSDSTGMGEENDLTYGWMACVNGCCRFYGPQPGGGMGNPGPKPGPPPGRP